MIGAKPTPGPLFVHDFTELGGTVDVSCDHPATITVASMGNGLTGSHAEKIANAHLFAAAPAMLDALQSVPTLGVYESDHDYAVRMAAWLAVRNGAIAKAKGEPRP